MPTQHSETDNDMTDLLESFAEAISLPALSDARKTAIWDRVQARTGISPPGTRTVRADAGHWIPLMGGVDIKILHIDATQGMQTALWRLQPGAVLPAHGHSQDEECLVLEGEIQQGGQVYRQGDFHLGLAGHDHQAFTTDIGALLLIRSQRDYLAPHH